MHDYELYRAILGLHQPWTVGVVHAPAGDDSGSAQVVPKLEARKPESLPTRKLGELKLNMKQFHYRLLTVFFNHTQIWTERLDGSANEAEGRLLLRFFWLTDFSGCYPFGGMSRGNPDRSNKGLTDVNSVYGCSHPEE